MMFKRNIRTVSRIWLILQLSQAIISIPAQDAPPTTGEIKVGASPHESSQTLDSRLVDGKVQINYSTKVEYIINGGETKVKVQKTQTIVKKEVDNGNCPLGKCRLCYSFAYIHHQFSVCSICANNIPDCVSNCCRKDQNKSFPGHNSATQPQIQTSTAAGTKYMKFLLLVEMKRLCE